MAVNYYVGDINKDTYINEEDVTILENYLADSTSNPLTTYQRKLADINQDGLITSEDLQCLKNYLAGDYQNAGQAGVQQLSDIELLDGFIVKLYILRTEDWETVEDDTYKTMIMSDLQEYKILPLTINIDLHSINKYYWTIKGKFLTKEPLTRDELQTIMININNDLRYKYAIDKVNFNSIINYKEVIETILAVDNRILMVDLDPIEYTDEEGNSISKSQLTGDYTVTIPKLNNSTAADNLHYTFKLANAPLLPGSIMIRVNDGQWTLRDNNNGAIYNVDNILTRMVVLII